MNYTAEQLWSQACDNVGDNDECRDDPEVDPTAQWYASSIRACTVTNDMHAGIKDSDAGNERAQRYVAEFMRLRMKG